MRLFVAALGTETNSFSPIPTGLGSFEEYLWFPAGSHPDEPRFFTGPIVAARRRAASEGLIVIEGLAVFAAPAGPTTRRAWETLRDRLLEELRAALPVQVVLLSLHGAMVADGYDDCEATCWRASVRWSARAWWWAPSSTRTAISPRPCWRRATSSCSTRSTRTPTPTSAPRNSSTLRCAPRAARSGRSWRRSTAA